jgi:hypothetical protein
VRLNEEELAQLESLDLPGARTPGQKLRALIGEAGALNREGGAYAAHLARLQARVQTLVHAVREAERSAGLRSELIPRMADGLAEAMAWLLAECPPEGKLDEKQLRRLESGLADRSGALARSLFELRISGAPAAYDTAMLAERVRPLCTLAGTAAAGKTDKKGGKGKSAKARKDKKGKKERRDK